MPIYEYECKKCGDRFELFLAVTDNEKSVNCPGCGGKDIKKVYSSFGINTSGTGCAPGGIKGSG